MGRLIVYSGPSCVGKTPLRKTLEQERGFEDYKPLVEGGKVGKPILYVTRLPRNGESEGHPYHFRTVEQIMAMVSKDPDRYIAGWIRDKEQFQALDLKETKDEMEKSPIGLVLLEIYDTLGAQLMSRVNYLGADIQTRSIFISPLSMEEISIFKKKKVNLSTVITYLMLKKLERRADDPLEACLKRAKWAYKEMCHAHGYAHVIVNHDGEDSDNWKLPYLIGDAKRVLRIFKELVETGDSVDTEHWPKDLLT